MKLNVVICILCLVAIFPDSASCADGSSRAGLFVTVLQEPAVLSSRAEITKLVDFARRAHVKVLYVQIYRANQSWFRSSVADPAPYKACLKSVSGDPFRILIDEAHAAGIEVHAWLNMLSLGANKDARILKKYGSGILTRNLKSKKSLEDYKIDDQYFLEPGDMRVRKELTAMIGEILHAYPGLDGVLYDYIRYPDENPAYGYTKKNVERFKKATGLKKIDEDSLIWKDWKRTQVTETLQSFVEKARSIRPDIQVAATGCEPYSRAYHEAFQDWPGWIRSGLVDSVTVMAYTPDALEFEKYMTDVKDRGVDLQKTGIAVGAYELGQNPETFARELELCRKTGARTCAIFHYGSLVRYPALSDLVLMWYNE